MVALVMLIVSCNVYYIVNPFEKFALLIPKQLVSNYEGEADTVLDCMDIRTELGSPFDQHDQQDPITYLSLDTHHYHLYCSTAYSKSLNMNDLIVASQQCAVNM